MACTKSRRMATPPQYARVPCPGFAGPAHGKCGSLPSRARSQRWLSYTDSRSRSSVISFVLNRVRVHRTTRGTEHEGQVPLNVASSETVWRTRAGLASQLVPAAQRHATPHDDSTSVDNPAPTEYTCAPTRARRTSTQRTPLASPAVGNCASTLLDHLEAHQDR